MKLIHNLYVFFLINFVLFKTIINNFIIYPLHHPITYLQLNLSHLKLINLLIINIKFYEGKFNIK